MVLRLFACLLVLLSSVSVLRGQMGVNQGAPAGLKEFPTIVSLSIPSLENVTVAGGCTGFLISSEWVLTAAHCFVERKNGTVMKASDNAVVIVAGFNRALQVRESKRVVPHPDYYDNLEKNIAVILADSPFVLNEFVKVGEFITEDWQYDAVEVRQCTGVSFGRTIEDAGGEPLRYKTMNVSRQLTNCPCQNDTVQENSYVCTIPRQGGGICDGDSGGPLICDGRVTGVASSTVNSDDCMPNHLCEAPGAYSVYSYIVPYLAWIKSTTGIQSIVVV